MVDDVSSQCSTETSDARSRLAAELMAFHDACTMDSQGGDGQFRIVCSSGSAEQACALRAVLREAAVMLSQPQPTREPSSEVVEAACAAYAKATGYYVEFHRGLWSESSNKMRAGMHAALAPLIENIAKICDDVAARYERLMDSDPKAERMTLAAMVNGAMECAENIRASSAVSRPK